MTRSHFVAVELLLVAGGLLLLILLFDMPFGGGGGDEAAGDAVQADTGPDAVSVEVAGRPELEGGYVPEAVAPSPECAPQTGRDFLSANQVVSFYGSPYTVDLGILGALPPDEMVARLREQASAIDATNGVKGVQPAFHLVSSTAQPQPGATGEYVLHVDLETLEEWSDLACREGMMLILDIQIGHADLLAEVERLRPLLEQSHVHLALDPEFAMAEGEIPGQVIGGYTAEEINSVQDVLQGIVQEKGIPDKILVVHQFEIGMIENPWDIAARENVAVAIVMDGYGDPQTKVRQFKTYSEPAEYAGIKLFYSLDQPLMTEAEIGRLYPSVIIYQ